MNGRVLLVLPALLGALALIVVASASAGQIFGEKFQEEVPPFVEEDFCGVDDLDVTWHITREGHAHAVSRGRDKLPYFGFNVKVTEVVEANGNSVTAISTVNDKDLRVTDHGDGTFTVLVLTTGNSVLYDEAGNVLARNPGQVRFEIRIDNAGTPTDPSDDDFIEFIRPLKDSTDRSDDYCEAALPVLLG